MTDPILNRIEIPCRDRCVAISETDAAWIFANGGGKALAERIAKLERAVFVPCVTAAHDPAKPAPQPAAPAGDEAAAEGDSPHSMRRCAAGLSYNGKGCEPGAKHLLLWGASKILRQEKEITALRERAERAEHSERSFRAEVEAAFRKHNLAAGPTAVDSLMEDRDRLAAKVKAYGDIFLETHAILGAQTGTDVRDAARQLVAKVKDLEAKPAEAMELIHQRLVAAGVRNVDMHADGVTFVPLAERVSRLAADRARLAAEVEGLRNLILRHTTLARDGAWPCQHRVEFGLLAQWNTDHGVEPRTPLSPDAALDLIIANAIRAAGIAMEGES